MKETFYDLRRVDFIPLSEGKARLSALVRSLRPGKRRIAITTNGRPSAVVLSYADYLDLLNQLPEEPSPPVSTTVSLSKEEWKASHKKRKMVRDSILNLFDAPSLSRKGQKKYKRDKVREFDRSS